MAVLKDKKNGSWFVMVRYDDWKGQRKQKCKRGFSTKREAQEWERHFLMQINGDLNMLFENFVKVYIEDCGQDTGYWKITYSDGTVEFSDN